MDDEDRFRTSMSDLLRERHDPEIRGRVQQVSTGACNLVLLNATEGDQWTSDDVFTTLYIAPTVAQHIFFSSFILTWALLFHFYIQPEESQYTMWSAKYSQPSVTSDTLPIASPGQQPAQHRNYPPYIYIFHLYWRSNGSSSCVSWHHGRETLAITLIRQEIWFREFITMCQRSMCTSYLASFTDGLISFNHC